MLEFKILAKENYIFMKKKIVLLFLHTLFFKSLWFQWFHYW